LGRSASLATRPVDQERLTAREDPLGEGPFRAARRLS
jgi:hypothetical protein